MPTYCILYPERCRGRHVGNNAKRQQLIQDLLDEFRQEFDVCETDESAMLCIQKYRELCDQRIAEAVIKDVIYS